MLYVVTKEAVFAILCHIEYCVVEQGVTHLVQENVTDFLSRNCVV